jgi:hypothetical protein
MQIDTTKLTFSNFGIIIRSCKLVRKDLRKDMADDGCPGPPKYVTGGPRLLFGNGCSPALLCTTTRCTPTSALQYPNPAPFYFAAPAPPASKSRPMQPNRPGPPQSLIRVARPAPRRTRRCARGPRRQPPATARAHPVPLRIAR